MTSFVSDGATAAERNPQRVARQKDTLTHSVAQQVARQYRFHQRTLTGWFKIGTFPASGGAVGHRSNATNFCREQEKRVGIS
jgi:hypothetical protein